MEQNQVVFPPPAFHRSFLALFRLIFRLFFPRLRQQAVPAPPRSLNWGVGARPEPAPRFQRSAQSPERPILGKIPPSGTAAPQN